MHASPTFTLRWPLPALLTWLLAWVVLRTLVGTGASPLAAALTATAVAAYPALKASTPTRRWIMAAGFPVSIMAAGLVNATDALLWLLPLAALMIFYPVRSWRDAPLFPTPAAALAELPRHLRLQAGASVLDAGCGLGHGLRAWHGLYPEARLHGVEWSWLWSSAARLWCPWAHIRRGDMWSQDWSNHDVIYVFQRPESMPRVWDKACREMCPGSKVVSLAFEIPDVRAQVRLDTVSDRPVWLYTVPPKRSSRQGTQPI